MKLLLTGGTGFFGRALLRHMLVAENLPSFDLTIISRHPELFRDRFPELVRFEALRIIQGDIEDRESLPWNAKFTHVMHVAADSTIGPQLNSLNYFRQILAGTENILDLAVATGAQRFLFTSSGGIYGVQPPGMPNVNEEWTGSPFIGQISDTYSHAKRAAEHLVHLYRDSFALETIVARCFSFLGIDLPLNAHFAIGNFIHDALYSDCITVRGDGSPLRSYLNQDDLAAWLFTILLQGYDGQAYNIGSDRAISLSAVAELVRDHLSPEKPIFTQGDTSLGSGRSIYVPDVSKIKSLHHVSEVLSLEESIAQVGLFHRKHRSIRST